MSLSLSRETFSFIYYPPWQPIPIRQFYSWAMVALPGCESDKGHLVIWHFFHYNCIPCLAWRTMFSSLVVVLDFSPAANDCKPAHVRYLTYLHRRHRASREIIDGDHYGKCFLTSVYLPTVDID